MQISPTTRDRYRFAVSIGVMGCLFVWLAANIGGWGWLLLWPAAAFIAVGLAYAGVGERVFAKRDGEISLFRKAVLWPWLGLQKATWRLQGLLQKEAPFHEIDERIYLGRYPSSGVPADVSLVVDMTAEFDAPRLPAGVEYFNLATLDACSPSIDELADLIDRLAEHRGRTYVHCASGHGRSGTVCAGLLMRQGHADGVDEAEAYLREIRPGVGLSVGQRRTLEKLRLRGRI